jgi:hypothetical protein
VLHVVADNERVFLSCNIRTGKRLGQRQYRRTNSLSWIGNSAINRDTEFADRVYDAAPSRSNFIWSQFILNSPCTDANCPEKSRRFLVCT